MPQQQDRATAARAVRSALDTATDPDERARLISELARINGNLPPDLAAERALYIHAKKPHHTAADLAGLLGGMDRAGIFRILRTAARILGAQATP